MFDKNWFLEKQSTLLWLANTWLGRRILCINEKRSSVGKNKIIGILPNAIFWKGKKKNEVVAEFRTNDKFGRRIYHAFKPVWYLFHNLDTLFINNIRPSYNLGFDTLTQYPGSNGTNDPVDGYVGRTATSELWADIRTGAGTDFRTTVASNNEIVCYAEASTSTDRWNFLARSIFLFDTSAIPDTASISATTLSLFGSTASRTVGIQFSISVVGSNPASTTALQASDYGTLGTTKYNSSDIAIANWSTSAYNDFGFNATGIANVSKTGLTKVGSASSEDITNTAPTWISGDFGAPYCKAAETTGTANDPKLVVTYSVAGTGVTLIPYMTPNTGFWSPR